MSLLAISNILIFITVISIAGLIFIKGTDRVSKSWGIFCMAVLFWAVGGYIMAISSSSHQAAFGFKIAFIGILFSPVVFLRFTYIYLNLDRKYTMFLVYLLSAIYLYLNFFKNDLLFDEPIKLFNQIYWVRWPGKHSFVYGTFYFLFYWVFLSDAFYLMIREFIKSDPHRREQLKYFIFGTILAFIGAHGNFFAVFYQRYPYANFFIIFYPIIFTYAILRHNLLDINIVIRKGLIYSVLAAIITALFFSVFLVVEQYFKSLMGYQSLLITAFAGFLIALGFIPLRNKIQYFIDKVFYKKSPDEIEAENVRLKTELERTERLRSIGTLAAGMAHEIKNPLTSIKTFTEYLPKQYDNPDFRAKFNRIVGSEVERIDSIVRNILTFSKPKDLKTGKVNIQQALDEITELLNNECLKYNIVVRKNYQLNGQLLNGDYNQLKQVFLNIILNAIDAMPNGGAINIETRIINDQLQIAIQDTGCGIEQKDIKHLFDPFFSKKDSGTGLGLSVAHGIIKRHKGTIEVESEVGKGTKFTVKFPIQNE